MLRRNQPLRTLKHDANVSSLFLCLQLWNIEGQCLRIVPVGKEVQGKVVEMQWQRIAVQEQKWARQCQTRKPLDRHGSMRRGQPVLLARARIVIGNRSLQTASQILTSEYKITAQRRLGILVVGAPLGGT